ncbi:membrane protein insertase YidC [Actinokineospora auranticolor]|uniref:Membrane protein insertase YidC n=1 Tax=Actinokineospora auranticolor TaxID=155976 RepID=A0A2S6GSE7_9PSEU|nr:membrane protein insertase YidC [Actinokineospora auranticolor]PPK68097.1 YidC/Oxa1 family membrane protein insertase [Actinokineospora auranticolor]
MLDFIYYPVSFIMWCWHWVFGHVFGEASAVAWALSIVFLVFTLRAIMFKPMVKQVRSMRKMQEFAPEIKKLQKKYANDRQKQAQEMQKLQAEHGVSPFGGCLPMLLQIPVFIGLFHVLREFKPGKTENYFFDERGVSSYIQADLFGARLSNWITQPAQALAEFHTSRTSVILVAIPLMLLASALTHLTARHSVSRQNPATATAQTGIMNKLTLYVFPLGVLFGGFFFPIGLILYWLSNNSWTLWQQRFVYKRIDAEEAAKKAEVKEKRAANAPKPGQKPVQRKRPATAKPADGDGESAGDTTPAEPPATDAKSDNGKSGTTGGTEIPGLISDRSRSKKSGRKNR